WRAAARACGWPAANYGRRKSRLARSMGATRKARALKREADPLPGEPFQRPIDPVVLLHLVSGRLGPLFRSQPPTLADFPWTEPDRRVCAFHQHDRRRRKEGYVGTLAGDSPLSDAVLRLQLLRVGQGKRFSPGFFAEPE